MTKRAGKKKKRRAHVAAGPGQTTTEIDRLSGPSTVADSKAGAAVPHSGSQPARLYADLHSVFWPEFAPEAVEKAVAQGMGDSLKRASEFRIELSAVEGNYPIPPDLRARMVYEAVKAMMNTKQTPRERNAAMKLLVAMDRANRIGDLPAQIQVTNNIGVAAAPMVEMKAELSPQAVVAAMLERADVLDAIDAYEFADSGEDYAS